MKITLSQETPRPLYQQIKQQIEKMIIRGELKAHDLLPSIRNLASEIDTSVITVKRAYQELERNGFIYSRPGLGTFVAEVDRNVFKKETRKKVRTYLLMALEEARRGGLTSYEVFELLKENIS